MKKGLKFILVLLGLFILVGCGAKEFKEIELTSEELKAELKDVEVQEGELLELDFELLVDSKEDDTNIDLKAIMLMSNNQIRLDMNLKMTLFETLIEGNGTAYLNNDGAYFDGSLKSTHNDEVNFEMDGKYKFNEEGMFEDDFINLDDLTNFDINVLLNNKDFLKLVDEYEGLTFYKNKNQFKMELIINNELLENNKELFKGMDLISEEDLNSSENIDVLLEVIVEKNKIVNINLNIKVETNEATITMILTAKSRKGSINNPNFEEFEDFDFTQVIA